MSAAFRIMLNATSVLETFAVRLFPVLLIVLILLAFGSLTLIAAIPDAVELDSAAISSYQISILPKTVGPWKPAEQMNFTIHITNTGDTWITALPLRDVYSSTYLSYGNCGTQDTADPRPDDYADDGQLDWSDLTAAAPYGFGIDLAPGASFTVIVTFTAASDTTMLPGGATENGVMVHDAIADPDGPGGPLPAEPLPDQACSVPVSIFAPTCTARLTGVIRVADDGPLIFHPTCAASIGGGVWHDVDFDGWRYGALEEGIDGALISTYWDNGDYSFDPDTGDAFYKSSVTNSGVGGEPVSGVYDFVLPPPPICSQAPSMLWVEVDSSNFAPGGVLENMVLTSEETYFPQPALVPFPSEYASWDDISFGFNVVGSYAIATLATQPRSQRIGLPISISFRVTNTGESLITSLPLKSLYDPIYLTYAYASPPSDDNLNDGVITWQNLSSNLVASAASAVTPAAGLFPGGSVTVVITFTATADTSYLPGDVTTVMATSEGAFADPDGPSGYLSPLGPLPASEAIAEAEITIPTGLALAEYGAEVEADHVRLTWQTANEVNILGFNVLHSTWDDGELRMVNPELIAAEHAGANTGASYTYLSKRVISGGSSWYVLEVIHLDGRAEQLRIRVANESNQQ